jgi:hypothetical protein
MIIVLACNICAVLCCAAVQVALKAARLATEAHPSNASTWQNRLELEAQALGLSTAAAAVDPLEGSSSQQQQQQQQHRQQLFELVVQALKQVPAAAAGHIWDLGFHVATATAAAAGSNVQLAALQKQLLAAVTAAAVRGPDVGGLGAVVGRCLEVTWEASGVSAARKMWQQLLLLPPAGGDMFRAMVRLERASGSSSNNGQQQQQQEGQQQQQSTAEAVKRVRAVYGAWAGAYGSQDAGLWVEWALFEQQQGKAGAGKVYWRAVKALDEPEEFIAEYRQQVGVA